MLAGRIDAISTRAAIPRPAWRRRALLALSLGGVAFTVDVLIIGFQAGMFGLVSEDLGMYQRVGHELVAGSQVYYEASVRNQTFFYAPPWVALFGAFALVPAWVLPVTIRVLDVAALRAIGGSWKAAGLLAWFPLVPLEIANGNINLLLAAAIVLAHRGDPRLAAVTALAKVSPILAVRPRDWRAVAVVLLVAGAITLPWPALWPAWIVQLEGAVRQPYGPQVPIPLLVRVPIGLVLVATRRPALVALGAVIATPAFYWGSLVLLVAPLAVWLGPAKFVSPAMDRTPSSPASMPPPTMPPPMIEPATPARSLPAH